MPPCLRETPQKMIEGPHAQRSAVGSACRGAPTWAARGGHTGQRGKSSEAPHAQRENGRMVFVGTGLVTHPRRLRMGYRASVWRQVWDRQGRVGETRPYSRHRKSSEGPHAQRRSRRRWSTRRHGGAEEVGRAMDRRATCRSPLRQDPMPSGAGAGCELPIHGVQQQGA